MLNGQVGSPAYGVVSGVWIDHYQHAGISIAGPASGDLSRVSVLGNLIVGGWTIPSFQYGVDVEDGASAAVLGNLITGNVCGGPPCGPDPINQAQGDGVVVLGVRGPVDISGTPSPATTSGSTRWSRQGVAGSAATASTATGTSAS